MKRISVITSLVVSVAGFSAFGQGYFEFSTGKSQAWDETAHTSSTIDVAFLWGAQGAVPEVETLANGVPTTGTFLNPAVAWTAILYDPNFQLAVNSGAGNSLASVLCTSAGGISYNGGNAFAGPLATSPGVTYTLFMISWNSAYATPALAAAANTFLGWSQAFDYTATALTASPNNMVGITPPFGMVVMPEPATMALAGLGGVSWWLFRRRK